MIIRYKIELKILVIVFDFFINWNSNYKILVWPSVADNQYDNELYTIFD